MFGAGAIGSLFGGLLSIHNDVTLVCREEQALAIQNNGLTISGRTEVHASPKVVASADDCPKPDVLIISVKAYDTEEAIGQARPLVGEGTLVLSLQNGLGNAEIIDKVLGDANILCGVTSHGARLISPGVVEHTGVGATVVGAHAGCRREDAVLVDGLLNDAGIETSVSEDIDRDVWAKVLVNAAINPIATILGKRNGYLLEHERSREIMKSVISEGVSVAGARGIGLSESEVMDMTLEVVRLTADNKCSMLQDVERGCRTEIDYINGAIVRLGEAAGISTPVNSDLTSQIKKLSSQAQKI